MQVQAFAVHVPLMHCDPSLHCVPLRPVPCGQAVFAPVPKT
jgi:hypothetical protein